MCHPSRRPRNNPVLIAAGFLAVLGAQAASLDDARADAAEVDDLVGKASKEFADEEWDAAKKFAEAAETAAKKAGLGGDKTMARVYMMLGAVQVAGFNNPGKAIESFRRALAIDAGTKLTRTIAKPEVIKAFKSAVIMNRAEAASVAAHADAEGDKPAAKAEEKKTEKAEKAEDKKTEKAEDKKTEKAEDKKTEKAEDKAADKKADGKKADGKVAAATKDKADEDEDDEDVSLEELRRRAREAKTTGKGDSRAEAKADDKKADDKKADDKPELKKAVARKAEKPKDTEPEEPDLPVTIPQPLHCPNPDDAPPHQAAILRCVTQPGLVVARILLYYRLPGSEEFVSTPASKTKHGWYVMTAPAEAFAGKMMQYYFEARDGSDKPVAANGKWDSPNLMLIRAGAPTIGTGALAGMRVAGESVVLTDEDPLAAPITVEGPVIRRMWIALSIGTGVGASGNSDLEWYTDASGNARTVAGGFRSAGAFVVAAAFGYQLNDSWAVSLETRNEFILRSGSDKMMQGAPASGAHSILVKGTYLRPLFARTTLLLSGALGGGEGVRFVVAPEAPGTVDGRTSSDSVSAGPVLIGASAALDVRLARKISARVTLPQMLVGLPKAALVFDVGIGLVYHL